VPISWSTLDTPRGLRILRSQCSGELHAEDAARFERVYSVGGEGYGLPYLAVIEPHVHFNSSFRSHYMKLKVDTMMPAIAVVVPTAPLRALVTLIVKVVKTVNSHAIPAPVQLFGGEVPAVAWLEDTVARAEATAQHPG
jgi:hypothetical protein